MTKAVSVLIHPQVSLQFASHYTTIPYLTVMHKYKCGILFGINDGFQIEVLESIEFPLSEKEDENKKKFGMISKQQSSVFQEEKPLGFYTIDSYSNEEITTIAKAFDKAGMNSSVRIEFHPKENDQILVFILSRIEDSITWIPSPYKYASHSAERIALMELQSGGSAQSQVSFTNEAYLTLSKKLEIIQKYLLLVRDKKISFNSELVRKCADISNFWPLDRPKANHSEITPAKLSLLVSTVAENIVALGI